jgi:hypothetical protein
MKKIIRKQAADQRSEMSSGGHAKEHKGYNEQEPSQPHGAFRPDKNATKSGSPTSVKKRSVEKRP